MTNIIWNKINKRVMFKSLKGLESSRSFFLLREQKSFYKKSNKRLGSSHIMFNYLDFV